MATSIQHDLVSTVENEISCPICFEDFEEPKCLPNCAHNVCQHCLEGMVKTRNITIECPVCRAESVIPRGGVAAFPKNHLLVRLIEQSPGRKEKQSLRLALKNCKEQLEGTKAALGELEGRYLTNNVQDEKTKERIQSLAENIVKTVRDHERKLLGEIQSRQDLNKKTFKTHKSSAAELCENANGCIQTVQDILENGEFGDLKNLKDALLEKLNDFSKCLEERKLRVNREFTLPSVVSLTETNSAEKFIEDDCPLGKLTNINTAGLNVAAATSRDIPTTLAMSAWEASIRTPLAARSSERQGPHVRCPEPYLLPPNEAAALIDIPTTLPMSAGWEATPLTTRRDSICGSLIQTISGSSCGIPDFTPISVAASRYSDDFVALDNLTNHVYVFDEEGEVMNEIHIKFGILWDVAVSNDEEIVVVNHESNRLLHYDMDGNFQKKFVTEPEDLDVRFCSCTVDVHGRFIVTSRPEGDDQDTTPCILVYTPSGNLSFSFGEDDLRSPQKAVFLNGKFYVTDSSYGNVRMFDKNGSFLDTFGDYELMSPSGIAADYSNGNVVVTDREDSTVQIFSRYGEQLDCFETAHAPIEVSLYDNYKNLLICCEGYGTSCVQMLTYS